MSICRSSEDRLVEYGLFLRHPFVVQTGVRSVFARIARDHSNAGTYGDGFAPDIIDGIACRPDGGLADLVSKQWGELRTQIRVREVHEAVQLMRDPRWRHLVHITWVDIPDRQPCRPQRLAAEAMQLNLSEYRDLRARVLGYMEAKLYTPPTSFVVLPDDPKAADERRGQGVADGRLSA